MSFERARRIYLGLVSSLLLIAISCDKPNNIPASGYGPVSSAIISEFDKHDLVALGESHDRQQDLDLRLRVVHNREFPAKVHNIVVEYGNALFQGVLDRYIAGEEVSEQEIRKVWRGTVSSPVSAGTLPPSCELFLHEVRLINQRLPSQLKLRVLAGDPPIDWTKVKSKEDFLAFFTIRDEFPVHLIEKEILAKGEKALIIYGAGHVWRNVLNLPPNLATLLDRNSPGKLFTILRINGLFRDSTKLEALIGVTSRPVFLKLTHTTAGELSANEFLGRDIPMRLFPEDLGIGGAADACVYSGKKPDTVMQPDRSVENDPAYQAELARRRMFIPGPGR